MTDDEHDTHQNTGLPWLCRSKADRHRHLVLMFFRNGGRSSSICVLYSLQARQLSCAHIGVALLRHGTGNIMYCLSVGTVAPQQRERDRRLTKRSSLKEHYLSVHSCTDMVVLLKQNSKYTKRLPPKNSKCGIGLVVIRSVICTKCTMLSKRLFLSSHAGADPKQIGGGHCGRSPLEAYFFVVGSTWRCSA